MSARPRAPPTKRAWRSEHGSKRKIWRSANRSNAVWARGRIERVAFRRDARRESICFTGCSRRTYDGRRTSDACARRTTMEDRGESEWELAHRELLKLAVIRATHEHALCGALLRAKRAGAWRAMGMASFHEYAGRIVGLSPRQTE